ncbi:Uncharacterised protein [Corynebacterium kutscheri]|uniref:Uncharacterized protein n=1 Tax=Corynebacterium kutscheri TaxID=35755 RepID=A0A0F6TEH3_9CORY|nr:hypothetical protein [Corynebacterium kutscheri]AKE42039.1 hypothetical protein UL82_09505 [Corynebacterium kutscheri]VEH06111.1 Uncharacterised protein [Corynebacterium kutscheri]VEH10380.1 Uncharacterised protein [Corynebacterium kutscheri]VEH82025.1 Uncharacterised protein [Corynebacterium kutscheri]
MNMILYPTALQALQVTAEAPTVSTVLSPSMLSTASQQIAQRWHHIFSDCLTEEKATLNDVHHFARSVCDSDTRLAHSLSSLKP